jgi:tetratricopeptide (TPR) repeat protein
MKSRFGLVLASAIGLGLSACASGGTGSSSAGTAPVVPGGQVLAQGERPRPDDNTRSADRALEAAGGAADEAAAMSFFEEALTAAQAAVAADTLNPLPYRQAATALIGLERWAEADQYMTRAEELRPIYQFETETVREQAWIGLYQEAIPLVNSGAYEEAAVVFENANHIYRRRPEVMVTLGQIYGQLRRHDEALEQLDNAMEILGDTARIAAMDSTTAQQWREQGADIPLTRAQVLADAGRFEEAVVAFRALRAEDPEDIMISRNLAAILVQMGETEEAFSVYDDLMTRPDLTSQELYSIGIGFYQGDDWTRAALAFQRAAERSVKDRDAVEMWARSLQLDSAFAEMAVPAEEWIALDPYNQNGFLILAQSVNLAGDDDRARELIAAIEAMPVQISNLQITRFMDGGAALSGSMLNQKLEEGSAVALTFTFYDDAGNALGDTATSVVAGGEGMATVFQIQFASDQAVGGYGYQAAFN